MGRLSDIDEQVYLLKIERWGHEWLISNPSHADFRNMAHHKAEIARLDAKISALVAEYDRIVESAPLESSDTDEEEDGNRMFFTCEKPITLNRET
jgi:hypothetical protein